MKNSAPLSADNRAAVCSWAGTFAPSGAKLGPALDSVERLGRMLTWAADAGRLTTEGTIAQVWIVGATAVDMLGWLVDPDDIDDETPIDVVRERTRAQLTEAVARDLSQLERQGWTTREGWETGGAWVRLERIDPTRRRGRRPAGQSPNPASRVDVILEPFAWTTPAPSGDENLGILGDEAAGWGLPAPAVDADDEAVRAAEEAARAELGRRLKWCVEHLGILPALTESRTGAALVGKIWRDGAAHNRDIINRGLKSHPSAVMEAPVPMPPLTYPPRGERGIEPPALWAVEVIDPDVLACADRIVISDQRGSYLGSFSVPMPVGDPVHLSTPQELDTVLWLSDAEPKDWPQGLWAVMLPRPADVPGWDVMPPAHQEWWRICRRDPDTPPIITVTTETLRGLAQEWTGGLGIDWCRDNVAIVEGWAYPRSVPALAKAQTILGNAYKAARRENDFPMRKFVSGVYQGYQGAMANTPDQWGKYRAQHSQPVAQAHIHAHARWRGRRQAVEVHDRTGVWPITMRTDALGFLVPAGADLADFADADPKGNLPLGRLAIERWCTISGTARAELAAARSAEEVAAAVANAFTTAERVEVYK
ncbi:hypothetical protein [Nocardia nova]